MYSSNLQQTFKKLNIEIGDAIKIQSDKGIFEGMLMPRAYESDTLVLKLSTGYNLGLDSKNAKIELLKKGEAFKKTEDKPAAAVAATGDVSILGCGGTISSRVEYNTGAVYPVVSPKELLAAFPKITEISSIKVRKLFSLLSEDMAHEHWQIAAKEVANEINDGASGVVLMHGTDTMGYTAAALSFMLQDLPVPVILVGAQRSSDRPSSDNELNLMNSIYAAKHGDMAEVAVCMHATENDSYCYLHRGTRVRKFHNSRRDAFKSVNVNPLVAVDYRKTMFEPLSAYSKRDKLRKLRLDTKMNDNVALVYVHPGIKPKLIDSLSHYDGVVLIGTGLGHAPTNPFDDKHAHSVFKNIKGLIDSDIPVVMSSQTIYGRINMNVYSTGRVLDEAGVIGNGADWTPETAFVKLCWVLAHEKKMNKIKQAMMTPIAGEISEHSTLG